MSDLPQRSGATRTVFAVCFSIILVIAALTLAGYVLLVKIPTDLASHAKKGVIQTASEGADIARRIGRDFAHAFQFTPEVTLSGTIVLKQNAPVLELATVTQGATYHYSWAHSWLNSTKTLELESTYVAKAGFDLREAFSVDFDEKKKIIRVRMPRPKILSIEIKDLRVLKDHNGWWNKIQPSDREKAMREMQGDLRKNLERSDFLQQAQTNIELKLKEIGVRYESGVVFEPRSD